MVCFNMNSQLKDAIYFIGLICLCTYLASFDDSNTMAEKKSKPKNPKQSFDKKAHSYFFGGKQTKTYYDDEEDSLN